MSNKDSVINLIKQVVTVDFMSSIEASELFCNNLVGKSFELIDLPVTKSKVNPNKEILQVKYQGKHRNNIWFLSSFLKNAMVSSVEDNVDCPVGVSLIQLRQADKFPYRFVVEGFIPSNDPMGNPYYAKAAISEVKVRKLLKGDLLDAWLSRDWSELKAEASDMVRANYSSLFRDDLMKDGKLTKEAEDQYRLGTMKLRIAEVADLN
jgi:hypothetical protein